MTDLQAGPVSPPSNSVAEEWVAWWFHDGRLAWVSSYPTWAQAKDAVVEQVERLWLGCGTEAEWQELHTELCTACSRDWTGSSASAMDSFSVFQATPTLADIFIGNIRPHLGERGAVSGGHWGATR